MRFLALPSAEESGTQSHYQNNDKVMNAVHTFLSAIPAEEFYDDQRKMGGMVAKICGYGWTIF